MTTTSPLIRRLGSGYCASGSGFYLYDEDLQRVLERVAELTQAPNSNERGGQCAGGERREQDRAAAKNQRATSE
jgi:hypothetical protein